MTVDPGLIDWSEREYISQFAQPPLTFVTYIGGVPADPDGATMTARLLMQNPDGTSSQVNTYTAARQSPGTFIVTPSSADTQHPGYAELDWSYAVHGQAQQYASYLEIGKANPHYDALPPAMQDFLNQQVWVRFSDLFDSAGGGPNLESYFQAHWSRGRAAQMMGIALQKINAVAQPWSSYTIDGNGGPQYPIQFWGGLLASYTYVECVKQLIRSYTEQPAFQGPPIARQDRRDYTDRWRAALQDEQAELKSLLDVFKIRHILNGSPRVLVSGGTYGRYAPTRIAGSVAARPRMWARWKRGTNRSCAEPQQRSVPIRYAYPHDRSKSQGQAPAYRTCRSRGRVLVPRRPVRRAECLLAMDPGHRGARLRPAQLEVARRPLPGACRRLRAHLRRDTT